MVYPSSPPLLALQAVFDLTREISFSPGDEQPSSCCNYLFVFFFVQPPPPMAKDIKTPPVLLKMREGTRGRGRGGGERDKKCMEVFSHYGDVNCAVTMQFHIMEMTRP